MTDACTWPEQDAVDAWLEKHKIEVPSAVAMELKSAVTAYRIEVQNAPPTLAAALAVPEVRALVEAAWKVHYRTTGATREIRAALMAFPPLAALRAAQTEKEG